MVALGYFAIAVVCAGRISGKLSWALAPAVGMGISAIIAYFFRRPMFTVEVLLLVILFVLWLRGKKSSPAQIELKGRGVPVLVVLLVALLSWMTLASFLWVAAGPHGEWDGWAIWNAHARYIIRAGPVWREHIPNAVHSDYPLLLPLATVRSWRLIEEDVPHVGGVQQVLIGVSGILILAASLWELRADSMAFLASLLLVGTPFYMILGVWQYADMPLSVYILSTLALICIQRLRMPDDLHLLMLAGFTAGCAASTKNEGLLFVVGVMTAQLVGIFRRPAATIKRIAMFSVGLLLPLAATLHFKFTVAPPNDIVGNRDFGDLVAKVMDPERYVTIADAFLRTAWTFGRWPIHAGIPLLAILLVWGIDRGTVRSEAWKVGAVAVLIVLAGYFATYVITHHALDYHLPTSLDRLLMHVWPSVLFLAGLAVRTSPSIDSRTK
jgi:hypothetical protein